MTPPPDLTLLDSAGKDALILALIERLNDLTARLEILEADNTAFRAENPALRAENAGLRAKLNLPPKKPDNSSTPPSRGQKGSEGEQRKPKGKPHAGAHRELHPHPTRRCDVAASRILESRNDIRAVFTDVQMPGSMDGLCLARVIRDRWPPVALIVTSANALSASNVPSEATR